MKDEENNVISSNEGTQGSKNKVDKAGKVAKNIKAFGKLGTIGIYIAIILVILFIAIGIFGFIETLPGLSTEKIVKTAKNFWKWLSSDDSIEVDPKEINELAEYIENMGFDIVGYGFAQSGRATTNGSGDIEILENDNKEITHTRSSNLYAYILSNERTYTIVGTSNGKRHDGLFNLVTLGGVRHDIGKLSQIFTGKKDDANYGMLQFEESLLTSAEQVIDGISVSINRNTNQLVIDTGRGSVSRLTWDLTGWTAIYGKPIELSLALHLSTMAPDFVYDFCMDDDLQTKVVLATERVKYKDMTYKYLKDGASQVATQSDVDKYYEKITEQEEDLLLENNLFTNSKRISMNNENEITAPVDVLFDTNIVAIKKKVNNNYVSTAYYKAVDKDGNTISLTKNYEVKLDDEGAPYFEEKADGNIQYEKFVLNSLIEQPSEEKGEIVKLSDDNYIVLEILSLNDMKVLDSFGKLKIEGERYGVVDAWGERYYKTLEGLDEYINHTIVGNKKNYKENSIDFTLNLKNYEKKENTYNAWTFNSMDDTTDYPKHNALKTWQTIINDAVIDKTGQHIGDVVSAYGFQDWLEGEITQLKYNRSKVDELLVPEDVKKYLNDTNLDAGELMDLHDIFNDLKSEVNTYMPYIKRVVKHWYKDVYFIDDDGFSVYDKNVTETIDDTFIPDSDMSDEKIDEYMEKGKFYYNASTDDAIEENKSKRPKYVTTEPWHYKVKNWIEYGYYFIYDGSEKTAEQNELASHWLELNGYYSYKNPLLLDKYAKASSGDEQEKLSTSGVDKASIDKEAKKINDLLEKNGYTARLQKIDFKKQNSLTAFSILEGMHTEDTDKIYEMLQEFLIELGYFSYTDFQEIETDVLKWLIPDYEVYKDEWPDSKYERVDNEYGAYIRSKSSLDEQKSIEAEKAKKETEEHTSDDNETNQLSDIYKSNSSGNTSLVNVGRQCWEYIVNSGRYVYDNSFGKPIPPTDQNYIDCSAFVSWILYEAGYEDFGGYQKSSSYFMNTNFKDLYNWTEISVNGNCLSKIQAGDIVARNGHVTFVKSIDSNGTVWGYDCGDQSFWSKSNINGVNITNSAINVNGPAKIIRLNGSDATSSIKIDLNSANTTTIAGIQETTVDASDFGEEGFATITTVNGISYKNYKQGTYPGMGVSSKYSQICPSRSSDTFGYVGCGPTSTAVVLSAYGIDGTTGTDALPYVCGELEGTHTGGTNSCESIKLAFDEYNIPSTVYYTSNSDKKEIMDKALKEGRPIIANVNAGYYSPGGHYIAILGYDSNDDLVISNPCGSGIYGVCGSYSVTGGVSLDYFVTNILGGGSGTFLIPDEVPTGFSYSGPAEPLPEVVGFESGLDIIMPEHGKIIEIGTVDSNASDENSSNNNENKNLDNDADKNVNKDIDNSKDKNEDTENSKSDEDYKINVTGDYVIIEFESTSNGISGWKLKIEGFALDTVAVKEDTILNKGDVIGITTESNIKVTLYDEKDAIMDNIEDYFVLHERESKKSVSSNDFGKLFFIPYESGAVDEPGCGPDIVGDMWGDGEYGVGICQWTVAPSLDAVTPFLERLYNKDQSFCSELKGLIGINMHTAQAHNELKEVFANMGKKNKEYLLKLEMEVAIEEKTEIVQTYWQEYEWLLDRSDPVVGTWFSLINYGSGLDWCGRANINQSMSDEEIIKRLCYQGGIQSNSQVGNLMTRFESQARLAVDMLDGKVDAEQFVRKGLSAYPDYGNGENSGYLNGYN